VRKGKSGKLEEQTKAKRTILSKERTTRMEGSFGAEKDFYSLRKIRARTMQTEILWIFFGIHTVNAVRMIPKMNRCKVKETA